MLQVFMSVDEPDASSQDTPGGSDSTPTLTTVVTPAALALDERPLVEFDSPDSGLPSSRNYSVASGHSQILSSIEDGQSMEDEPSEESQSQASQELPSRQDSLTDDRFGSTPTDKPETTTTATTAATTTSIPPSFSSYTVGGSQIRLCSDTGSDQRWKKVLKEF